MTIYRWFEKLEDTVSDVPSKSLQRRMGLELLDELMETVVKALIVRQDISLSSLTVGKTP